MREGITSLKSCGADAISLYVDEVEGYLSGNQLAMEVCGGVEQTRIVLTDAKAEDINFGLKRSWVVSGTVYDWQNQPLANTPVSVNIFNNYRGLNDERSAVHTDKQGKYEIVGKTELAPGTKIGIYAVHDIYWSGYSDLFTIEPGQRMDGIDIKFKGSAIINGTVRNEEGEPIDNALVQFWSEWKKESPADDYEYIEGYSAQTDQNGRYECIIHLMRKYTAVADAVGYHSTANDQTSQKLDLKPSDEPVQVNFTLTQGDDQTIEGIVVDEEGAPVEGITVQCRFVAEMRVGFGRFMNRLSHTTDASGSFCFDVDSYDPNILGMTPKVREHILSGKTDAFEVSAKENDKYSPLDHSKVLIGSKSVKYPGEKDLRINVTRKEQTSDTHLATLAGRVVDTSGNPVTQYDIVVIPGRPPQRFEDATPYHQWSPVYTTDGQFQIDGLPVSQGAFYIAVRTDEYGISTSLPLSPEANQVIDNIEIIAGAGATITGTILDAETGKPIPGD